MIADIDMVCKSESNARMERVKRLATIESYSMNIPLDVLQQRFKCMSMDRWKVYFSNSDDFGKSDEDGKEIMGRYVDEYKTPDFWKSWKSRYPFPMAFEYNVALPTYNASVIVTDMGRFLAVEAPSTQNAGEFVKLIEKYTPKYIVKLNSSEEYPADGYFAYWEKYDSKDSSVLVGTHKSGFISYDWQHRTGTDINGLLKVVQSVINSAHETDFVAVSCRAGAGRTGTFIAACILVSSIYNQLGVGKKNDDIRVNVDEIVWQVSIQRPFAITHQDQYVTLYRLVDNLLDSISKS
jgi:hypothetical protein